MTFFSPSSFFLVLVVLSAVSAKTSENKMNIFLDAIEDGHTFGENKAADEFLLQTSQFHGMQDSTERDRLVFVPEVQNPRFQRDRFGQQFITCNVFRDNRWDKLRCFVRGHHDPVCRLTIAFTPDNIDEPYLRTGCSTRDNQKSSYSKECTLKRTKHTYVTGGTSEAIVHSCFCTESNCNRDFQNILSRENNTETTSYERNLMEKLEKKMNGN